MTQAPAKFDRETVARIIDPSSWSILDGYLAQAKRKYRGTNTGYDPGAFYDKHSIDKAAAIMALHDAEISRLRADMADAVGVLKHDDLARLSRRFNSLADLRDPQDARINEWLKSTLSRLKDAKP